MPVKKFLVPFAASGDLTPVPNATQPDGAVSYSQGYGYDYSRDPTTDPQAKNVGRGELNQILNDITSALGQIQKNGFPEYITAAENGGAAYPYAVDAVVRYEGANYISLEDDNTADPTDATAWLPLTVPDASTTVKGRVRLATDEEAIAGTDEDSAVTPHGLAAALGEIREYDIPFMGGYDRSGSANLEVGYYGFMRVGRAFTFAGLVAGLDAAPTGAALIIDVLKNGVSVYTVKPQFAAGSTTFSAGTLDMAKVAFAAGDLFALRVLQIGSGSPGKGLTATALGMRA